MCATRRAENEARDRLASWLPRRWAHVQAVAARAQRASVPGDADVLLAAAWLHDVGYSPTLTATGFHPLDGARHLRLEGFDDRLCGLVAYHSGAVIEAGMRGLDRQLQAEFAAETSEVADAL